jgi:hypothetical protein
MTWLEPLTFAVRGEASNATSVATSRRVVKRPVGSAARKVALRSHVDR